MSVVAKGDMETAQRLDDGAAKLWGAFFYQYYDDNPQNYNNKMKKMKKYEKICLTTYEKI